MKKVLLLSLFLLVGLILSQYLPNLLTDHSEQYAFILASATMIALSFIMIHVGYEFNIRRRKVKQYGKDYLVAFTSATFPWIFIAIYFFFLFPMSNEGTTQDGIVNSLLLARFAAPTSAGVLFSMLTAAGLAKTWMFKKTRILAIFDDLDTILLMVPLQMLIVGVKWQMFVGIVLMIFLIWLGWKRLHLIKISIRWTHVLFYAAVITAISQFIHHKSLLINENVPIHIEVLLPAFVIGMVISHRYNQTTNNKGKRIDTLELPHESKISFVISSIFMLLVGLSMPQIPNLSSLDWNQVAIHVFWITLLSNIGKMFPCLVYKNEATWKQRLAVSISMFPRGEVGAGVLIISISYGIGGMAVTVAVLSLCLNLLLTVGFIWAVKKLLRTSPCMPK